MTFQMTKQDRAEHDILWDGYKKASEASRHYFKNYMRCKTSKGMDKNWKLMKEADEVARDLWEQLKPYHEKMIADEKALREWVKTLEEA